MNEARKDAKERSSSRRRFQRLRTKNEALEVLDLIRSKVVEETALGKIGGDEGSSPFKVLISTMLSSRTRDPVTEAASGRLFSHFPDAESLSRARKDQVAKLIKPVNFYKTKTDRVIQVAKIIKKKYGGKVPEHFEELLKLPGVGRKTANCVMVYAFKRPAIPVDVHVHRISNRIGLVNTKNPETTEEELSNLYEEKYWLDVNELFVKFGQTICKPIVPLCESCNVRALCNYYQNEVRKKKRSSSA